MGRRAGPRHASPRPDGVVRLVDQPLQRAVAEPGLGVAAPDVAVIAENRTCLKSCPQAGFSHSVGENGPRNQPDSVARIPETRVKRWFQIELGVSAVD